MFRSLLIQPFSLFAVLVLFLGLLLPVGQATASVESCHKATAKEAAPG